MNEKRAQVTIHNEISKDKATYEAGECARIFKTTGQEQLRLEAALKGYYLGRMPEIPGNGSPDKGAAVRAEALSLREEYRTYLRRRIRPAAAYLAKQCDEACLSLLVRDGLVPADIQSRILRDFADAGTPAQWLMLLRVFRSPGTVKSRGAERLHAAHAGRAGEYLQKVRQRVYRLFPFLDAAMAGLVFTENRETASMGTDGVSLFYDPSFVAERFSGDVQGLTRQYLHILLHCIYRHWNLKDEEKADRMAEQMIEEECLRRRDCREMLGPMPACCPDDHSFWPKPGEAEEPDRRWSVLARLCGAGEGGGPAEGGKTGIGVLAGNAESIFRNIRQGRHDYRSFLRRFAVRREEMQIDAESFDYIFYSLGIRQYGNMPLIEPLEYTEGHKLEELVIAIDTSGSCTDRMVRAFLEETYAILGRTENFFRTMSVWILQCDCTIHERVHICSAEDWIRYCGEVKIKGRSGTDFRPVFREVEALREAGEIRDLKCLIYFTDGEGIYPREAPDYEAAFVRLHPGEAAEKAPPWALQLYVEDIDRC